MKKIILTALLTICLTNSGFANVIISDCTQFAHDAVAYEEEQLGVQYDFNTYLEVMNQWDMLCKAAEQ
ncbi:hypothetical protein [Dokdonia sp. Asnod1-B02]|uniref:hypothetical protein n=1 Tax=Dokdonia sp. Asnod1-B02 TaxID=3160573 RepID=UPI00387084AE